MLQRLLIENFKLIASLDLDFPPGTCAITGETGAGKSSVVQALDAALGGEAGADALRPGSERCEVQAWFDVSRQAAVRTWLEERDLPLDFDNCCVLRRTFQAGGRSRAQINGSPCTLAQLGEVGALLADLVVQNRHLSVLQPQMQLALVDSGWDSRKATEELALLYKEVRSLRRQITQLSDQQSTAEQRSDFLSAQLAELEQIDPEEASLENWEAEHTRLSRSEDFLRAMDTAEVLLHRGEESAAHRLAQTLRNLPEPDSDRDPVAGIHKLLAEAAELLTEAGQQIAGQAANVQNNAHRLSELDSLLGQCHQLARRHNCAPGELWRLRASWQQELEQLKQLTDRTAQLKATLDKTRARWQLCADSCSKQRAKAARAISDRLLGLLTQLGMEKASFRIALEPTEARAQGQEKAIFLYSPAPGVPEIPLERIASGGELSRMHLALHLSTSGRQAVASQPCLVALDEADAGIGGETAHRLAALVRQMGESVQVLCVTHLPQLAASAHHHLRALKLDGQPPELEVRFLSEAERSDELARMLGGGQAGEESRKLAERLLAGAGRSKGELSGE